MRPGHGSGLDVTGIIHQFACKAFGSHAQITNFLEHLESRMRKNPWYYRIMCWTDPNNVCVR